MHLGFKILDCNLQNGCELYIEITVTREMFTLQSFCVLFLLWPVLFSQASDLVSGIHWLCTQHVSLIFFHCHHSLYHFCLLFLQFRNLPVYVVYCFHYNTANSFNLHLTANQCRLLLHASELEFTLLLRKIIKHYIMLLHRKTLR